MNEGLEDEGPNEIPDENPPENISHYNEERRLCFQNQQLQPNSMSHPMQLPAGLPMNPHSNVQSPLSLPVGPGNQALLQYYEAQMRDHAAAYASAAAAAAMAAAQIAAEIASSDGTYNLYQHQMQAHQNGMTMPPIHFPELTQINQLPKGMHRNSEPSYQHQSWIHSPSQTSQGYNKRASNRSHESFHSSERYQNSGNCQRRRKREQKVSFSKHYANNTDFQINDSCLQKESNSYHNRTNREYLPTRNAGGTTSASTSRIDTNRSQQGQQKRIRRRRRFWNETGSSDSGDPSYVQYNNNNDGNRNRTCRNRKMAKATSSSSDGGSASWTAKKKQRQPNDDSLVGKTGVSALYEWSMKRRTTPTFSMTQSFNYNGKDNAENSENDTQRHLQQEYVENQQHAPKEEGKRRRLELEHDFFECTVSIDGIKMGTGRGPTKTSAKHEASRRALLTLLPGVEFDEDSGILIRLPGNYSQAISHGRTQQQTAAITSLEDLAPNLAKQLAIGHSNDDEKNTEHRSTRDSRKRQKWPHVYPGTSTTSDDEDENSYYASRGASVCSSLLHAMVQIDDRLIEPPEFTYQVSAITNETVGQHGKLKRKAGVPIKSTSTAIPRGSFECTGILKLQMNVRTLGKSGDSLDGTPCSRECYRLLRSSGIGGTKREARHTAAAKLLAMLFPECDGMADVKQAAESAREKYAASRALKQQSKRKAQFTASSRSKTAFSAIHSNYSIARNLMCTAGFPNTPEVPINMKQDLMNVLGRLSSNRCHGKHLSRYACKVNSICTSIETGLVRQLSRQQQLEERVDWALQKLNEHDDEGRSLPEELTVDDVGRTVLRRARVGDIKWIEKLFKTKSAPTCAFDISPLFETILVSDKEPSLESMRLWSSSTIVLLLCRAIAPHEDPPLGCAVLTLGFSLLKGKTLRIAQIASKPHQPRERFIETLSVFAKCMECSLVTSSSKASFTAIEIDGIRRLLDSRLNSPMHHLRRERNVVSKSTDLSPLHEEKLTKISLQAVKEEGEGVEESDSSSPIDDKEKRREKPSKRSRFE